MNVKKKKAYIILGVALTLSAIVAIVFIVQHSRGYQEKLIREYITEQWDETLNRWEELDRKNHEYDSEHYDMLSTYDYDISFSDKTVQVRYDAFDELEDWQMDDLIWVPHFAVATDKVTSEWVQKSAAYTTSEVICNSNIYTIEYTEEERIIKKNGEPIYIVNSKEEAAQFQQKTQELLESAQETLDKVNSGNSQDATLSNDEKSHIWIEAKYAVEEQLKSPSTADFPSVNKASITKSGTTYTVSSYVDAENSYGATIRTNFTVTVEKSGDMYTATSVVMD